MSIDSDGITISYTQEEWYFIYTNIDETKLCYSVSSHIEYYKFKIDAGQGKLDKSVIFRSKHKEYINLFAEALRLAFQKGEYKL